MPSLALNAGDYWVCLRAVLQTRAEDMLHCLGTISKPEAELLMEKRYKNMKASKIISETTLLNIMGK